MGDFLVHRMDDLLIRLDGPMSLRLIIQPIIAVIFAVRAGLRDGREGKQAFLWAVNYEPSQRRTLLRGAWQDIGTVCVAALAIDLVFQFSVLKSFHPIEAVVVAITLAVLPYVIVRATTTRIFRLERDRS